MRIAWHEVQNNKINILFNKTWFFLIIMEAILRPSFWSNQFYFFIFTIYVIFLKNSKKLNNLIFTFFPNSLITAFKLFLNYLSVVRTNVLSNRCLISISIILNNTFCVHGQLRPGRRVRDAFITTISLENRSCRPDVSVG